MRLLIGLLFLSSLCLVDAMRKQSAAAKGRLHCAGKPASGVKVRLVDKDTDQVHKNDVLDDLLNEGYTDSDGRFSLQGDTVELTTIDVQLKIYHNCNNELKPCPRKWVIDIPDIYVTAGPNPKKVFDLGDVNLEVELDGETMGSERKYPKYKISATKIFYTTKNETLFKQILDYFKMGC